MLFVYLAPSPTSASANCLKLSPEPPLQFGNEEIFTTTRQVLTVTSTCNEALMGEDKLLGTTSEDFRLEEGTKPCPGHLLGNAAPLNSCEVLIYFEPTEVKVYKNTVFVEATAEGVADNFVAVVGGKGICPKM
jgi:hypothetical protein